MKDILFVSVDKIAVIGGSNGGYATAADLSKKGFSVRFYVRTPENHRKTLREEKIKLRVSEKYNLDKRIPGAIRDVPISKVTTNLEEAVQGAKAVIAPLPTTTNWELSKQLVPVLEEGQFVFITPGNFGSYIFSKRWKEKRGSLEDITFAETPTLPYVTRRSGENEATINLDAVDLPLGAFPGNATDSAYQVFSSFYSSTRMAKDALDAALNNSNVGVNAVPTVLNAGAIESDEIKNFNIHRQGVSNSVYKVIMDSDEERVAIRRELNYGPPDFTQDDYYQGDESEGEHFYGKGAHDALFSADTFKEDPPSLDSRYVHEDIGIAAVFFSSLGKHLGIETPVIDSVVDIACSLMDIDYKKEGRTVENLDLEFKNSTELKNILK
ncbi:hypothetical protein AKJ38_02035 [candidate division MSBL1 archaeon SCGC-AAA259I14]|uniref:Opine dehydrogenase domain-containing protein n=1 Tax=candidate division MSBL1 archaeon SCGC-AAA259I14 TaxID=1698268 RepID=A0A133USD7_9EURY|nr:hypothetical protein AKJ38_02035 [candidate division MSBL1 archaeon SCGC-AAA259I14]